MKRLPDRRRARVVALALAVAALASACVSPGDPGVSVDARSAQLVFGVKLPDESAPTPTQAAAAPVQPNAPSFRPPAFNPPDLGIPDFEQPPPVVQQCPPAAHDAVPRELAGVNITGDPREGIFAFRGTERQYDVAQAKWSNLVEAPVEHRAVRRFERSRDSQFQYQTVQPLGDHFLVTTYQVKTDADRVDQPAGEGVLALRKIRDPEGGLVLKSTEVRDAKGNRVTGVQPFQPNTGLLLLPLPVVSGEQYDTVAVDPRTGVTVQMTATVGARQRIDACGTLTEGWKVVASQTTVVNGERTTIDWTYVVGPQYGATLLAEEIMTFHAEEDDATGEAIRQPDRQLFRFINQLVGDPLPPELE